jgi:tetratricopeptide (TPR) repeat protein
MALTLLVCAIFWPMLGFEFVDLDVRDQLLKNPYITGLTSENLKHIFTSLCIRSYYPVRTLSFAVDYQLWGLNPAGFKLTNGLFHLASVLLVFWLILRLFRPLLRPELTKQLGPSDVAVAAFSAGLFAVHPVVVEPVTWVAGREELLMTLGALGCIHCHLFARRLEEQGGRTGAALAFFVGAAVSCAAACLSNAVGAAIPAMIVAWDVLTLSRPKWRRILFGTSALWVIGVTTIVTKKLAGPDHLQAEPGLFLTQRVMTVLNVYWLNLRTVLWPQGLTIYYDQVKPESFLDSGVILGAAAVAITLVVLWKLRNHKLALFGLLWFILALAPASQIMPHHIHRADRFLYLPLVGLALAVAAALRPLRQAGKGALAATGMIAAALLSLVVLGTLSARQLRTWRNGVSLWEHCARLCPNSAKAHDSLADNLAEAGQFGRAIPHYQKAMMLRPNHVGTLNNYAHQLASCRDARLRNYELAIRLATQACELTQWKDPKVRSTLAMAHGTFAESLAAGGQFEGAIENYRKAIKANPQDVISLFDLALLLATCRDEKLRVPGEAVRLAEYACELTKQEDPVGLMILAAAYAEAGEFEVAIDRIHKSLRLARASGNGELAAELQFRLRRYQHGTAELELR